MSSQSPNTQGSGANPSSPQPTRKGSVKRARELLEAGVLPNRVLPSPSVPRPPPLKAATRQTQWPLPASGLQPHPLNLEARSQQDPRLWTPRAPLPTRPPTPKRGPSPTAFSIHLLTRSFSHPQPPQALDIPRPRPGPKDDSCVSPTSTFDFDLTPRISITTDDLFRQSTASSTSSIPIMPPVPSPEPRGPAASPWTRTAGLAAPNSHGPRARASSVSPIPESEREIPDPRRTTGSLASSRAIPSSWGSGPAESEILGAYLYSESDDNEEKAETSESHAETLVRNASLGKRQKPTMRTIMKSNPNSEVSIPNMPSSLPREEWNKNAAAGMTLGAAVGQALHQPSPLRRNSTSTTSAESCVDPEKPRFANEVGNTAFEKEVEVLPSLPKAAPTMSDKRPGGRKPPRLDMGAVRDAEARGSLSSLSDLIRRATRLASNLDRGRTASRADLAADPEYKGFMAGQRRRGSGSLSDILTSFPRPGLATLDDRTSWPIFFGRSNLCNVEPLNSNDEVPNEKQSVKRKCCGMPRKWFIVLCIILFIVVVLAVLLPVFLVAVPKENAGSDNSCATTNACHNGGVSVSSGSECSCVCVNGYTGSQCTTVGDSSCTTSEVDNGTIYKNATMGNFLPTLFSAASSRFDISLDSVTIMALFSLSNVSCKNENALVSFSDVKSRSNTRRSIVLPLDPPVAEEIPSLTVVSTVTATALAARAEATMDGILYESAGDQSTRTRTDNIATATHISASTSTTAAAATTSTASVPDKVIEFSQVAVLYILEKTGSIDSALFSESEISSYLTSSDGYSNTTRPELQLLGEFGLNFQTMKISVENGTST
ncbi:uncharacterized protein N7477_006623 [Penicillium maclennaniae]|uniref:uncharacterized protein n=1 Tax=Penicillium maclennaniae TaxID=1343394 RepID=UPI0025418D80|nr:uncharacterized protein N7477_006623 [Penicillium maclennaniae]KAJ5668053.1 hypothetical protein N7477_006623 [Penicillium maclennaniae]